VWRNGNSCGIEFVERRHARTAGKAMAPSLC
jgi:hypothetical protein